MRRIPVTLMIAFLVATSPSVSGQHRRTDEGERKPEIVSREGVGPPLNYLIRASVVPDSALVRGQVDIQYQNLSSDTIKQLYLDLGRSSYPAGMKVDFYGTGAGGVPARGKAGSSRAYTIVDSLLYRAARLDEPPVMITDSIMQLTLPVGIGPGETGELLVLFESRLTKAGRLGVTWDSWFIARRWFPRLAAPEATCDGRPLVVGPTIGNGPARYDVMLKIDSSFTLIAPGELLNEKLHYGTFEQAESDTVFADVLSHMFAFSKKQTYTPSFESGIKDYYFLLPSGFAFPLVVARDVKLDRAYAGDLPVEVYYPENMAGIIQRRVAKVARRLADKFQQRLGTFPFPKLMVVAQDRSCVLDGVHELIGIGKDESSPRLLYPYLADRIAGCWFGDEPGQSAGRASIANPCLLASGIARYVAMREVFDSLGEQSTECLEMFHKLAPECADNSDMASAFREVVAVNVPWEMRMLRFLIGDSLLWQSLGRYSSEFRRRYPSSSDLESIIASPTGRDYGWFFKEWQQPDAHLDYYLSGVAYKRDDSGVTVEGYVRNHGNVIMPVELAFVTRPGDTLLDTLGYRDFERDGEEVFFSVHLARRPRAVVIDPHHFLPDSQLDNNTRTRFGRRPRYREPSIPIPGFRN